MKKNLPWDFAKEKKTKNIYFKENNYYFITSFTCFIKFDITKCKNYKKVHELSKICRTILSSNIDARFNLDKVIFITDKTAFVNGKGEIQINKSRRKFHTEKHKFYDTSQNKIRDVET